MDKFYKALHFVGLVEGGFTKDPDDPGNWTGGRVGHGELVGTKYGVSAASYPNEDIPNITRERADALYKRDYWDAIGADALPHPLSLLAFDVAVNSGVGAAKRLLEQTRNPIEFAAIRLHDYTTFGLWSRYGKGWARRVSYALQEVAEAYEQLDPEPQQRRVKVFVYHNGDAEITRRTEHVYTVRDDRLDVRKIA